MAAVWILAESRERTCELLSAGITLAAQLGVKLAAFATDSEQASEYISRGSDEALLLPPLAADQPFESFVPVIVEEALRQKPGIILVGAGKRGKEMAARIAARLNTGLCSDCTGMYLDQEKQLIMERMLFGGAAVQTVLGNTRPWMATVPARIFEPAPVTEGRAGEIRQLPAPPPGAVTVIERTPGAGESIDITEAKVIVCVGRGVEKKEDIALARELAGVLGGEVGCSRPVAEDLRWLPEELYIGISGKKVKPVLYIGVGIAGQIQHVSGVRDSKVIVAINRDENAPVFESADYGIVGDLYDVVPKLIAELKAVLKV